MYFLPPFRDQGHTSLRIRHDLVSLLQLDSSSWSPRNLSRLQRVTTIFGYLRGPPAAGKCLDESAT